MRRVIIAIAVFMFAESLSACLWSHGTDLRGKNVAVNDLIGAELVTHLLDQQPPSYWARQHKMHEARAAGVTDRYVRNDYAVTLLHVGETAEAIRILHALEKEKGGHYITAVNLGTAYELGGDDVQALRWI